jgi:CheY-like chemotaxis protein
VTDITASARILAVEPDPRTGAVLHRILDKRVLRADLKVVRTIDAALGSISQQVPDLILTSTFLPPADLARLIEELGRRDDAAHTQIISTPHALEEPEGPFYDESERILRFPRQRTATGAFHCDPVILRNQIDEYLEQVRALRLAARDRQEQGLVPVSRALLERRSRDLRDPASISTALVVPSAREVRALHAALRPSDRRTATRRRAADLAGHWGIRLDPPADASIVDISRTGVRLETRIDFDPGSLINMEVIGMEDSLSVAARLIRSEMVPGGPEVRYRAAAMFVRELDLFPAHVNPAIVAAAAASSASPGVLADVLGRVLSNANWVSNGATLWSSFESEVSTLVRAREVRIRAVPVRAARGCQSLYFNIPSSGGPEYGLHVVFDRGYRPSAAEFRLLKAVASLASVVIDLAPPTETPPIN